MIQYKKICGRLMLLLLWLVCICSISRSQPFSPPVIEWQTQVGDSGSAQATSIVRTKDGGFAVAGLTGLYAPDTHGATDGFISKLSASGRIEWQMRLGGSQDDYLWALTDAADGGYAAVGQSYSTDGDATEGQGKLWVVKLDSIGVLQWSRRYGGSCGEDAHSIIQTGDGGFAVAGATCSDDGDVTGWHPGYFSPGNKNPLADAWILKLDSVGNIEWERCVGGSGYDEPSAIIQTRDGGYAFAGATSSTDGDINTVNHGGLYDLWVVKLSSLGAIQWQNTLGGSKEDDALSIVQNKDGTYFVPGISNSTDGDVLCTGTVWLLTLDTTGKLISQRCLTGKSWSTTEQVIQTSGGGYAIGGYTQDTMDAPVNAWLAVFDSAGLLEWQDTILDGMVYSAIANPDGSFILAGQGDTGVGTYSSIYAWVVKLAPESSGVAEQQQPVSNLRVFPNPATNAIQVTPATGEISILDPLGRIYTLPRTGNTLDISSLPSGVYFVIAGNEHTKFIKE